MAVADFTVLLFGVVILFIIGTIVAASAITGDVATQSSSAGHRKNDANVGFTPGNHTISGSGCAGDGAGSGGDGGSCG